MGENFLPKTFTVLVLLCAVINQHALGQVADNFNDGDFIANPAWQGTSLNYTITTGQLRLNAPAAGTSYLSTPFSLPANHNASWEFFLRQNFAPSGSNCSRVYLMSNQSDLTGSLNGYFLLFGEDGANDAIKLFKQTGITNTQICSGPAATINASPVIVRVKVTRDVTGHWEITADYSGGSNFVAVATGNDNTHTLSAHFGFRSTYTVSNIQNFFYDDVFINTQEAPDETAPTLTDIEIVSETKLSLLFSEKLSLVTANNAGNFLINDHHPTSAMLQEDEKTVTVVFDEALPNGHEFDLEISGVEDLTGNVIVPIKESHLYFQPVASQKHDLAITEFYPDPNPSVGLPLAEFVEIFNRSDHPFDLAGWQITDQSSTGTLTTRILLPGEYLILCHSSDVASFTAYGNVMGLTTFPGLNNAGDTIKILNPLGKAIDSLAYNMLWYQGIEDKQTGGWTLEKINPHDFCKEKDNWTPALNPIGGTPGQPNSVLQITQDLEGPKLLDAYVKDAATVTLEFSEKLNTQTLTVNQFVISPSLTIDTISFANGFAAIDIGFTTSLDSSSVYSVTALGLFDCPGNPIQPDFGSIAFKLDSIPPTLQFVEVLNDTTIDLQFNERLSDNAFGPGNFSLHTSEHPNEVIKLSSRAMRLVFQSAFANGVVQHLIVKNISDHAENKTDSTGVNFLFFQPVDPMPKDIIISELFPDPAPAVGLPEAEFIELFNRSATPFNLQGWQITDGTSVGILPDKILLPDHYVILCPMAHKASFLSFGETIGLSVFPSLNNSSDNIKLFSASSILIDSTSYKLDWYHHADKKDGGYSMEIINPDDFCKEALNWSASTHDLGGTPGKQNSLYSELFDQIPPRLKTIVSYDAQTLSFVFDEKMREVSSSDIHVQLIPALPVNAIGFADVELTNLLISFSQPLDSAQRYEIAISGMKDCAGNDLPLEFSRGSLKLDTLRPKIQSWTVVSSSRLALSFSKKLKPATASDISNFTLEKGNHPIQSLLTGPYTLELIFEPFENGADQSLRVAKVEDIFGNRMEDDAISFRYFEPRPVSPKDIVISEIFPDPSPTQGLPETEFIELLNRSANAIDLAGWTIGDGGTTIPLKSEILMPGRYLILCAPTSSGLYFNYGKVLTTPGFPSLNNIRDTLVLKDPLGVTIDSMKYTIGYYRDEEKENGGWTLELIDPNNTCAEETNWIASENINGGTPGTLNSVNAEMPDLTGPIPLRIFTIDSTRIKIVFNEKLSTHLPGASDFRFEPELDIFRISFENRSLQSLIFLLSEPLDVGVAYSLVAMRVYDCAGNQTDSGSNLTFALPQLADPMNVVINEVLFNPRSTGVDFVEAFNQSNKFINLKSWSVANRIDDTIQNKKIISDSDLLFHPNTYLVFTHDAPILKGEYLAGVESTFVEIDLPSLPDEEGSVVLLDDRGNVIDLFQYSHDYHSVFLKDEEGVSLERIHSDQSTNGPQNWKSASAAVGFATPGYPNSNQVSAAIEEQSVSVQPEVFSPTGQQSFAEIHYQFDRGNLVANVKVIDSQGREVKVIADNELLGTTGFFRWDGDRSDGTKARIGTYMIWFEVFDETGRVEVIRKRAVLAERF